MNDTVVFIDFSKNEYRELNHSLSPLGAQILVAASIPEMVHMIPSGGTATILVGMPAEMPKPMLDQFLTDTRIRHHFFVFIGRNISQYSTAIAGVLPHAITLDYPVTGERVLAEIRKLHSVAQGGASDNRSAEESAVASATRARAIDRCFEAFDQLNLRDTEVNCSSIFRAASANELDCASYAPPDERVQRIFSGVVDGAGAKVAGHLHRTAAASVRFASLLNLNENISRSLRNAASLIFWDASEFPSQLIGDYTHPEKSQVREQFRKSVHLSAKRAGAELGLDAEGEILEMAGALIQGNHKSGNTPVDLASSSIVSADIVDRVCWGDGHWNPRGVNLILRRMAGGAFPDVHPHVRAVTIKALMVAVEGMGARLLRAQSGIKQPAGQVGRALETKGRHSMIPEKHSPLSGLSPGMKASQPIKTLAGDLVVEKDTVLDRDLIWRLWQLSAVRPVNPISIYTQ